MAGSAYDLRGTEKPEDLDWTAYFKGTTEGLVIIETLPPVKGDAITAEMIKPPAEIIPTSITATSFDVKRNGSQKKTRTAGMVLADAERRNLEEELYPGSLTNINIVIPERDPHAEAKPEEIRAAIEHVDNAYRRIISSGLEEADVAIVFELNGIPLDDGLGKISSETLLEVINQQKRLYRLQETGDLPKGHVLPIFIVKALDPFSQPADLIEQMYRALVNPNVQVSRIDTRHFTAERLAEFFNESGAFNDEPVTEDHPVIQDMMKFFGGNANLAYTMRKISQNIRALEGREHPRQPELLKHAYAVANVGGRFPVDPTIEPPVPVADFQPSR